MKGALEAKKAFGPTLRLMKLLEVMKEINILPAAEGSLYCGPEKSMIFTESKYNEVTLVARSDIFTLLTHYQYSLEQWVS